MAAQATGVDKYGRKWTDGPQTSRPALDQRQASALNETKNGELRDGKRKPWTVPARSKTLGL